MTDLAGKGTLLTTLFIGAIGIIFVVTFIAATI